MHKVWAWSKLDMGINWAWVPIEYVYSLGMGTIVYRQGLVQFGYGYNLLGYEYIWGIDTVVITLRCWLYCVTVFVFGVFAKLYFQNASLNSIIGFRNHQLRPLKL